MVRLNRNSEPLESLLSLQPLENRWKQNHLQAISSSHQPLRPRIGDRMRIFIAIPLPTSVAVPLSSRLQRCRHLAPQLRWMNPETWHVTLQFLGNSTPERASALASSLDTVTSPPISMGFSKLECFDRARVLVAAIHPNPHLDTLCKRVLGITSTHGFALESRPFTPHITLARWKGPLPQGASKALSQVPMKGDFQAEQFVLFQSFTEPSGARYQALRSYSLV